MSVEVFVLECERGVVPVAVETGFADPADARCGDQLADRVPVAGCGVRGRIRLDPDDGVEEAGVRGRQLASAAARGCVDADHADAVQTGRPGTFDNLVDDPVEGVQVEVGVGVEQ